MLSSLGERDKYDKLIFLIAGKTVILKAATSRLYRVLRDQFRVVIIKDWFSKRRKMFLNRWVSYCLKKLYFKAYCVHCFYHTHNLFWYGTYYCIRKSQAHNPGFIHLIIFAFTKTTLQNHKNVTIFGIRWCSDAATILAIDHS